MKLLLLLPFLVVGALAKESTHRYSSSLVDNSPSGSTQAVYKSGGSGGKSEVSSEVSSGQRNAGSYISGAEGAKNFQYGGQSVEYGGAAEGTGNFHSLFPSSQSSGGYQQSSQSSGGYPSAQPPTSGGYPASQSSSSASASASVGGNQQKPIVADQVDLTQPHGPAYTYYYQHYPGGNVQNGPSGGGGGWGAAEGHEEGGGGLFGDLGGGFGSGGGGIAGIGGIGGLKGLGIIAAVAKGILAIKPFLILGLLFLIAIPVLLLFLPVPIITVTGSTNMQRLQQRSGRGTPSGPQSEGLLSYVAQLSEKVLSSEECLERLLCKMPNTPENYRKKVKSLWDQWGDTFVRNQRISKGLKAYFENATIKNKNFKCDQKFQCSNKFI